MKLFRNEKGIALVTVLVLSLISLTIIAALIYLVTQGTKLSGAYKRYATALEAGVGGTEIFRALIRNRGNLVIPGIVSSPNTCNCGNPDIEGDNTPNTCLCRKLCDTTASWVASGCNDTFDPTDTPDLQFSLAGFGTTNYEVSAKIVDTTIGNSDLSGEDLISEPVVGDSGTIQAYPLPYLYRIEINSQDVAYDTAKRAERARLSVLYAY